jgi:hypothetical protein
VTTTAFGEPWNAPIVDAATWVDTPAGASCYDCGESIEPGDRGFARGMILDMDTATIGYVHAECDLRSTCGHTAGLCSCTGYPPNRATARLVWAAFYGDGQSVIRR